MKRHIGFILILGALTAALHITAFADEVLIGIGDGPVEEALASSDAELRAMQDGSQLPTYIVSEDPIQEQKSSAIEIADNVSDFASFKKIVQSNSSASSNSTPVAQSSSIVSNVINATAANPFLSAAQGILKAGPGSSTSYNVPAIATTALRSQLVKYAAQFLGNPYTYGGTSLTNGADCSGYVQEVFRNFGIKTGRTSRDQYENCMKIQESELQPGDLVFYASDSYVNHVAIYAGEGIILHAANESAGICTGHYDYRTPYGYGRFLLN
jgi:cell wall-associated NlpC family hydrolase